MPSQTPERDRRDPDAKAAPDEALVTPGAPDRDQVVTFSRHYASYNAGESAAFTPEEAQRLADLGVTEAGPPTDAPVNVTVPQVSQTGDTLNCTMGEWDGVPTSYAYQWKVDGTDRGTDASTLTVLPADVGATATCIVTATNAVGSTEGPPSNGVVVT